MANQKAILKGTYLTGPKAGKPADQPIILIDADVSLATFTLRNAATQVSFPGDVQFYDLVAVAATATATRFAPVVDGDIVNARSSLAAFVADPKSAQGTRFGDPWVLPTGSVLAYESFAS